MERRTPHSMPAPQRPAARPPARRAGAAQGTGGAPGPSETAAAHTAANTVSHTDRLRQIRQARRARRLRNLLLMAAVALLIALLYTGAYGSTITFVQDAWDSLRISLTPGPGYPQKTGLGELYQAEELAGGFAALAKQDLLLYSPDGRRLRSIQHGYARPAISVGGRRVCLYNRSGYEVRIESRSKTLYTKTFEQPILLCAMSPGGSLAVVTRSTRYAAELSVYSAGMEFRYGWHPTDNEGTPIRVAFAPDNRRLTVACLSASGGDLVTGLYWLDTRSDEIAASATAPGSTLVQLQWLDADRVLAVYDDKAAVYDADTGEETASYSYGGRTLVSASACGRALALLLEGGARRLVLLDDALAPLAETAAASSAARVVCTRTAAYSLEGEAVRCYTLAGEQQWLRQLDDPPQALLSAEKLLLFCAGQVIALDETGQGETVDEVRGAAQEDAASSGADAVDADSAPESGAAPADTGADAAGSAADADGAVAAGAP